MTEKTQTQPATATTGRAANIALWVLQVLMAAMFVFAGFLKVTADPQQVAGFAAMGLGNVGMYTIGVLELAGAVALLIPRLAGLAGLAFVGLMVGAVIIAGIVAPAMVAVPAVTLVLVAIIAWGRRRSTAELVSLVRAR